MAKKSEGQGQMLHIVLWLQDSTHSGVASSESLRLCLQPGSRAVGSVIVLPGGGFPWELEFGTRVDFRKRKVFQMILTGSLVEKIQAAW